MTLHFHRLSSHLTRVSIIKRIWISLAVLFCLLLNQFRHSRKEVKNMRPMISPLLKGLLLNIYFAECLQSPSSTCIPALLQTTKTHSGKSARQSNERLECCHLLQ